MSVRSFRLALVLFLTLSCAVAGNLVLLQPNGGRFAGYASLSQPASPFETSSLRAGETAPTLRRDANPSSVMRVTAPDFPVLTPPVSADRAETTRAVQRELQSRGYDAGVADGVAGLVTQAAIMAYEADHGMVLTAEPSEALLRSILLGDASVVRVTSGPVEPSAKAERVIRNVQQSLARLGYQSGKPDGKLGESTIKAIRDFEKQQGMPDTGRISGQLVARLTRLAGEKRIADGR